MVLLTTLILATCVAIRQLPRPAFIMFYVRPDYMIDKESVAKGGQEQTIR